MSVGKTALIVAGAGFGLLRSLRVLDNLDRNRAGLSTLQARVDTIHVAVARLADQMEQLQIKLDQTVTKDELAEKLDQVFGQLERGVDARFEHQTRSVEALRMMIGQTDELLQRVLDGLESMTADQDGEHRDEEWNLSQAAL